MSTATDTVVAFNDQLAQAKIDALQKLQSLMASLARPDAPLPAAAREIRLLATSILRTQPISSAKPHAAQPSPQPAAPPSQQRAHPAPANASPSGNPSFHQVIAAASKILQPPRRPSPAARLLAATSLGLPPP